MDKLAGLGVLMAVVGTGGAAYWWLEQPSSEGPAVHAGVVLDASDSMADDECRSLGTIVAAELATGELDDRSRVFLSTTGTAETALEPILIASGAVPWSPNVMEGVEAGREARRKALEDWVSACTKARRTAVTSPIFLGVKRGVEQLRGAGCTDGGRCRLYVRTDGQETEEPWIRDSLKLGKPAKGARPEALPNDGVKVVFCGFSETRGEVKAKTGSRRLTGKRNAASADVLPKVWREVFTRPDMVTFLPFCPRES